ncbi:MAG TPA: hypothetical protein VFC56_10450 [Stellaceae bacterium]|nr:hypothetical protein [Stellaceae bacterium]
MTKSCQLAASAHCNFRSAGGCDRPATMDCAMWGTAADERARRERVAKIARDADPDYLRTDLEPFTRVMMFLAHKLGDDAAEEARLLITKNPDADNDDKPETRSDHNPLDRLFLWARERLSPDDRSELEQMLTTMDLGLSPEGEAVLLAGDQMSVVSAVREAFAAEAEVLGICGPIAGMACDSAAQIYAAGCKHLGVDATGTYGDGARTLFRALARPQPGSAVGASSGIFSGAFDGGRRSVADDDMADAFPGYDRISRQG